MAEGRTKIRSSTLGDVHDGLFEIAFEFTGDARIRFPHFKLDSTLLLEMLNRWHRCILLQYGVSFAARMRQALHGKALDTCVAQRAPPLPMVR